MRPGAARSCEGEIQLTEVAYRRRRQLLCRITDGTGSLTLRFFYFSGAQQAALTRGTRLRCFGEVRRGPLGLEIVHPEYRRIGAEAAPLEEVLTPIYPTTEGVPQPRLRSLIESALREAVGRAGLDSARPCSSQLELPSLLEALGMMHRPPRDANLASCFRDAIPPNDGSRSKSCSHTSFRYACCARPSRRIRPSHCCDAAGLEQKLLQALPFSLTACADPSARGCGS